jgi:signal transduction histidine kinase
LKTPLTVMKSTIEMARNGGSQPHVLDDLEEEINDLSTVVADLQALSLADADAHLAHRTTVDFSTLCVDAAEILQALGEGRNISVDADVEPHVSVAGDPSTLKQMVLNLGDNGVRYTAPGGTVSLVVRRNGNAAVLEVSDRGPGIPPEELPRIFDRFYRGRTSAKETRGSGLGLAIAKRIVEVHDGQIDVASTPGQGTTFTVRVPIKWLWRPHGGVLS